MKEIKERDLNNVSGGIPPVIVAIATVGGVVAAANEVYKFSRGFRDGYKANKK